ncbi:MAG: nucleotide exchange factor GrpE [Candidatus Taylorbacteria bacterium]
MSDDNSKNQNAEADDIIATDEEGNPLKKTPQSKKSDDGDVVAEEERGEETIGKLREKLKICVEEKQKYLDGWQRDKADFINSRKRDKDANAEFVRFANEGLLAELIPVLDSFGMAMGNKELWEKADKNWRTGVEYIASQLKKILDDNGLKEIDPSNSKFDPMRDEAIEYVKVDEKEMDQVVTSVIQKGYSLNGRVLKAPKVRVGEFKEQVLG